MSLEVLTFLLDMLNRQSVPVGAIDFEETVKQVLNAKRELTKAISDA